MQKFTCLVALLALSSLSMAASTGTGYTSGPDSSFSINMTFGNSPGSTSDLVSIVLDGGTATAFPVLWDSAGSPSAVPGATVGFGGVDTQVLTISFGDSPDGFNPGESLTLSSMDPDGDPGPLGVTIGQLAGVTAAFNFEDGSHWNGVFVDNPAQGAGLILAAAQPAVPVPGAMVLAALGTGLVGTLRRRRSL